MHSAESPDRRSFTSACLAQGIDVSTRGGDLYRLKEIMGHADMKTTVKYAHLRPDALIEEMEKCFG